MSRCLTQDELLRTLEETLEAVRGEKECIIVAQPGKDGVAIVPIELLMAYDQARHRLIDTFEAIASASDFDDEDEVMRFALEQVEDARRDEAKQRRPTS